jgi:integrase
MIHRLTVKQCDAARPQARPYRLHDGAGLALLVLPAGGKYWQLRYRFGGRYRSLQIGPFASVSLRAAREQAARWRAVLREGRDPVLERQRERRQTVEAGEGRFAAVAREWLEHRKAFAAPQTVERDEGILRRVLLPVLADVPLTDIDAPLLLRALRRAEKAGAVYSAHRARVIAGQIFTFAIASGRATRNPAREIAGALRPKEPARHRSAPTLEQAGELLRRLLEPAAPVSPVVRAALHQLLLTGLRDRELRGATWGEIDFERCTWHVPATRMKRRGLEAREGHRVPLPRQAVEALQALRPLTYRGPDSYVFASSAGAGHLAENTLRLALHRLGVEVTAHGARSLLTDVLYKAGFPGEWVERQLHHKDRNPVRAAYLRTDFLEERARMMQWFADALDACRDGRALPPAPVAPALA